MCLFRKSHNILQTLAPWSLFIACFAQAAPKALVYKGPGACQTCSQAAAQQAEAVGLEVEFVGPTQDDPKIFENAAVWIQPGGRSSVVSHNMLDPLKNNIRNFIHAGGGYVGFCAGGFFATRYIREQEAVGLDLLPGKSFLYEEVPDSPTLLTLLWQGIPREMYWEGGPYFTATEADGVEILATYPNGSTATLRAPYGSGRVVVTGVHPEAPQQWRQGMEYPDRDGLDEDLAQRMVSWGAWGKED